MTAAYEGADECADGGPVGGTDEEALSIFACRIQGAKKFQPHAMISLRETRLNDESLQWLCTQPECQARLENAINLICIHILGMLGSTLNEI